MTKRTVEIDDVLPDCVNSAIEGVDEKLRRYVQENALCEETPCLSNDLDYNGDIHSIVDAAVPVYDGQIDAAWFLYRRELEEAYDNAGVGDNPRDANGMAAIYYYIYEKVAEWYAENAEEIFEQVRHDACSSEE